MSPEELAAAIVAIAIVAYTLLGGADFGGGIWTLFATGPRKAGQRSALERAIGPVWETNHIWLILVVVVMFVVFPPAYAAIFEGLYVPFFIALIGIVARGAAFAFRHYGDKSSRISAVSMQAFSVASLLTPFAFGLIIGALTSGHLEVENERITSGAWEGWLEPFSLMTGLIGLLLCAFLAAAYMVPRTEGELREDFRRRAIIASLALGVATTLAIPVASGNADEFFDRLDRPSVLAAMAVTAVLGLVTLWSLWRGYARPVMPLAAATAGGVIVSWALAQSPNFILPGMEVEDVAAASIMVKSFLIALPAGSLILVPSFWLLYNTFSREVFEAKE